MLLQFCQIPASLLSGTVFSLDLCDIAPVAYLTHALNKKMHGASVSGSEAQRGGTGCGLPGRATKSLANLKVGKELEPQGRWFSKRTQ